MIHEADLNSLTQVLNHTPYKVSQNLQLNLTGTLSSRTSKQKLYHFKTEFKQERKGEGKKREGGKGGTEEAKEFYGQY